MIRSAFIFVLLTAFLVLAPDSEIMAQKRSKKKVVVEINEMDRFQAEKYFIEGEKYYILEDYAKAYVFFQKSLDIIPDKAACHFKIADILRIGEDYEKAILSAIKAMELDPNNKYYYIITAEIYGKMGNHKAAAGVYEDLIVNVPNTKIYLIDLGASYLQDLDYENALRVYSQAQEFFGISEEFVRQKQRIYLKLNQLDNAIEEGESLIEAYPENADYVYRLANMLVSNNQVPRAVLFLEKLVGQQPNNGRAHLLLSEAYQQMGEVEKARDNLLKAFGSSRLELQSKLPVMVRYISLLSDPESEKFVFSLADLLIETHPEKAAAYSVYGDLYFKLQEKEEALSKYLMSVEIEGANFSVWQNILTMEYELGHYAEVIEHSDKAIEYFPNQGILYYLNGMANLVENNHEKSIASLEHSKKLMAGSKDLISNINAQLGDAYNGLKEYEKSDAAYEQALDFNPDFDHVLNNYSYFLSLRKENLGKAKRMSTRLVKRNPDDPTFLDTHGWVLYTLGEYKESKEYLEKAAKNEASGVIIMHYGDVLFKLGDIDNAVKQWERAKGLDDSLEMIDKKIADRKLYE